MAAFQTGEIAAFQTIEVSSDGGCAIAFPVDEDGRKGQLNMSLTKSVQDSVCDW